MTCSDCAALSVRHESMVRECDRLRADLDLAERERAGLLAEIVRLKDRAYSLAAQITGGVP